MSKATLAFITTLGIMSSGAMALKAVAAPGLGISKPYEWTIEIKTKPVERQFQYTGSSIKDVVKAELSYYSMDDQDHKTAYEDLWYASSKTLGLERHHKLELKQGDAVAISVKHEKPSPSTDEKRAAGKAVMKAVLDANINKNMVATIKVPYDSFSTISNEILEYHFSPAPSGGGVETEIDSDMNLFIESVPAGLHKSFVHYH